MLWVYLIMGLFALGVGGTIVWKYNHALEEAKAATVRAEKAETAAKEWSVVYDHLNKQYALLNNTLKNKTLADNKLRKDVSALQTELARLKETDPAARTWADQPVPATVVNVLRNAVSPPAEGRSDKGSNGVTGADPAPGIRIQDKRGAGEPAGGSPEGP